MLEIPSDINRVLLIYFSFVESIMSGVIAKPVLRGLHNETIKRNLIVSGVLVTVVTLAVKFLRNEPRKNDYAEFYK